MTRKLLDCPLSCPRFRTREEVMEHLANDHIQLDVAAALVQTMKSDGRKRTRPPNIVLSPIEGTGI